jgi:hypothetical protein
MRFRRTPVHDIAKHFTDARIIVEAQDSRFWQCRSELFAVALCHTTHRYNSSSAIRGLENGIDGILLCRLDEPTRVHEYNVGLGAFGHQSPAVR